MQTVRPIGVFDSGYGGLTVFKELLRALPQYDFIYLGDNARTPYGTRSFDVVFQYTLQSVKQLFALNCPLIILACNTASAKALRTIQQKELYKISSTGRVLGVIRPTTESIGNYTHTGHVGILGTEGTVNSNSYIIEINKFFPDILVSQLACPMWVPLVENNVFTTEGARYFIKKDVDKLLETDPEIDVIVLACTHYPLLKELIKSYVSDNVQILSQGELVAQKLTNYLSVHSEIETVLTKNKSRKYLTTEYPKKFEKQAGIFLKENIKAVHIELDL